jgi:hypothetical protein
VIFYSKTILTLVFKKNVHILPRKWAKIAENSDYNIDLKTEIPGANPTTPAPTTIYYFDNFYHINSRSCSTVCNVLDLFRMNWVKSTWWWVNRLGWLESRLMFLWLTICFVCRLCTLMLADGDKRLAYFFERAFIHTDIVSTNVCHELVLTAILHILF